MKRFAFWVGTMAVLAVGLAALRPEWAAAKDPTVKEVMARLHKGANCPLIQVKRELQAAQPDWADVQRTSREFVVLGAALARNPPPKGSRDSWSKLTKQYLDTAQALDGAAQRKNKGAGLAAQGRLAASCAACHKAHRD
jgi:hypothetical protein